MRYVISILFLFSITASYAGDITVEMLNKRTDGQIMVYSEDISRIDVGDTITWIPTTKGHNVEKINIKTTECSNYTYKNIKS